MLAHLKARISSTINCSEWKCIPEELSQCKITNLLDGKLAAAARGSKLSKNEGSRNSIICKIFLRWAKEGKKRVNFKICATLQNLYNSQPIVDQRALTHAQGGGQLP